MADVKITDLTLGATPLTGTELLEIVQSGTSLKITSQDIANLATRTTKVTLSSAEILALFTTPKTLVAAQGANTVIQLISVMANYNFNTTAYSTSTDLQFSIGNWAGLVTISSILANTGNKIYTVLSSPTNGDPSGITNTALRVIAPSGNPITGNSTVDLYVTYKVISL